jgi:hypothetical protein
VLAKNSAISASIRLSSRFGLVTVKEASLVSSKEWTGFIAVQNKPRGRLRHAQILFAPNREDPGLSRKNPERRASYFPEGELRASSDRTHAMGTQARRE